MTAAAIKIHTIKFINCRKKTANPVKRRSFFNSLNPCRSSALAASFVVRPVIFLDCTIWFLFCLSIIDETITM